MTPYARRYIFEEEVLLFEEVRRAVLELPDLDLGFSETGKEIILSCHMLARALGRAFPLLRVTDGYFAKIWQHTWLITPAGHLLDAYPVAQLGGPILLDGGRFSPARHLYEEKELEQSVLSLKLDSPDFLRSVEKIYECVISSQTTMV